MATVAEPRRFELVRLLLREPRTVSGLVEQTGWHQPLVSHHLAALLEAGLLDVTQKGRTRTYSIVAERKFPIRELLAIVELAERGAGSVDSATPEGSRPERFGSDSAAREVGPDREAPDDESDSPPAGSDLEDYLL